MELPPSETSSINKHNQVKVNPYLVPKVPDNQGRLPSDWPLAAGTSSPTASRSAKARKFSARELACFEGSHCDLRSQSGTTLGHWRLRMTKRSIQYLASIEYYSRMTKRSSTSLGHSETPTANTNQSSSAERSWVDFTNQHNALVRKLRSECVGLEADGLIPGTTSVTQ